MPEPSDEFMRRLSLRGKLAGGGGGSDDGGDMIDQRVATLEVDMREVKGSLARIEATLARMDARFDKMEARFDKFDERMRKVEIDVARIDGRIGLMPSTYTLIMTMVALSFSILGGLLGIFLLTGRI